MADERKIFVTVGTTCFDKLIKTLVDDHVTLLLKNLGYTRMTLQIGRGNFEPDPAEVANIDVEVYRLKPSIHSDIEAADLVISHAGAGSVLEILEAGKALLVVINEDLMDNHQIELAKKFHQLGNLFYTTCSELPTLIPTLDVSQLRPYEKGQPEKFASFVDKIMGAA